jgi:uncharacterized repeat protein (TIGR03806 family)
MQTRVAFPNLSFNSPIWLTYPPDGSDRVAVLEQIGKVHIFPNDPAVSSTTVFLDLTGVTSYLGENGLLGLAFHPDYRNNGYFYIYYAKDKDTVLSRWQVSSDPNVADPTSEQIMLEIEQAYYGHNGGTLAFGPDGKLYLSVGDGGSAHDPDDNAQDLSKLLGSILRLNSDGTIPSDNPFVGGTNGERGEIWAYGLRNPWRMSFDPVTGELWCGDVGQDRSEEVNLIRKGGNYGWPIYEGTLAHKNPNNLPSAAFEAPIIDYDQSQSLGLHAVIGGLVYRGSVTPSLDGAYVYGDYGSGRIWALERGDNGAITNTEIANLFSPSSFGEDEQGELYICSFDGKIHQLVEPVAGGNLPQIPGTLSETGLFTDLIEMRPTPGLIEYEINSVLWSDGAEKRRWLALPGLARIGFDATGNWSFPVGTALVKHFEIETVPGTKKRLETRVLLRQEEAWRGFTYRWNEEGTEAFLLEGAESETFTVTDSAGMQREQTWNYPSRAQCMTCHTPVANFVLGPRSRQLNRDFDYEQQRDNQLRSWNHIGLFTADIGVESRYEALPDPQDSSLPSADRARSYLAANCSMCHQPFGTAPVPLDLRYGTPVDEMNALGFPAATPLIGPDSVLIKPGVKEESVLWERIRRRDHHRMPPLGSSVVDDAAVKLIGEWIDAGAK